MKLLSRRFIFAVAVVLFGFNARAQAEPIVITGGFLTSTGSGNVGEFVFIGAGFRMAGNTDMGFVSPAQCTPCVPGEAVNLSSLLSGGLELDGAITIDGSSFSNPADAHLVFTAPSIVMPGVPQDFTVTRPFTFSGNLLGLDELGEHTVFTRALTGGGTLTASFRSIPVFEDVRAFDFVSITYDFTAADPVPEPCTLLLVGSGLGGLLFRRRKLRSGT